MATADLLFESHSRSNHSSSIHSDHRQIDDGIEFEVDPTPHNSIHQRKLARKTNQSTTDSNIQIEPHQAKPNIRDKVQKSIRTTNLHSEFAVI
jgi:hypothetical protein